MNVADVPYEVVVRGERGSGCRASIVIPVLNQLQFTTQCIQHIRHYTDPDSYELIIINNGSTDGTREYLDGLDAVVAIHCEQNIGVGPAWNLGIQHSRGDFVCVLNNDLLLTPGWLERLLWPFSQDDGVWCTGPVFTRELVPSRFDELAAVVSESEPQLVAGGIVGFCFALRRIAIEELGPFDQQFETAWFEDTDYYCRLIESGHPPALATNCLIHHYETQTAAQELSETAGAILKRNQSRFLKKWGVLVDPGTDVEYTLPHGTVILRQPAPGVCRFD